MLAGRMSLAEIEAKALKDNINSQPALGTAGADRKPADAEHLHGCDLRYTGLAYPHSYEISCRLELQNSAHPVFSTALLDSNLAVDRGYGKVPEWH